MLFLPSAQPRDELGEWILAARDAFVSGRDLRHVRAVCTGSAPTARAGAPPRRTPHGPSRMAARRPDADARCGRRAAREGLDTSDAVGGGPGPPGEAVHQAALSLARRSGLLPDASEFAALVRFARDKATDFELPGELRPKNAYNLVRLLATATRWLREGSPTFTVEVCPRPSARHQERFGSARRRARGRRRRWHPSAYSERPGGPFRADAGAQSELRSEATRAVSSCSRSPRVRWPSSSASIRRAA